MKTRINRRHHLISTEKQRLQEGSVSKIHTPCKLCKNDKHVWWSLIFLMQPTLIKATDCGTDGIERLFFLKISCHQ